jgi:hypothetical protein
MRTLTGLLALVLVLVLAAGCSTNEPTDADGASDQSPVFSTVLDAEFAATGVGSPYRPVPLAVPATPLDVDTGASPIVETTGEPWLTGLTWATVVADADDDPRLETVAERVPSDDARPPLAVQVVAERPSRPHDHTHPGTE